MINFTIIIGLCGSGKTYLANSIYNAMVLDDFELREDHYFSEKYHHVITNPNFCFLTKEQIISKIKQHCDFNPIIEFILFENNLDNCLFNIKHRKYNNNISIHFMKYLSEQYNKNYNLSEYNTIKVFKYEK